MEAPRIRPRRIEVITPADRDAEETPTPIATHPEAEPPEARTPEAAHAETSHEPAVRAEHVETHVPHGEATGAHESHEAAQSSATREHVGLGSASQSTAHESVRSSANTAPGGGILRAMGYAGASAGAIAASAVVAISAGVLLVAYGIAAVTGKVLGWIGKGLWGAAKKGAEKAKKKVKGGHDAHGHKGGDHGHGGGGHHH